MHEDFKSMLDEYQVTPKTFDILKPSEIGSLAGRVPDRLIEVFQLFGRFTFLNGWTHCCHPNDLQSLMEVILSDDPDLRPEETAAYAYSAFGTISFYNQEYGCGHVTLPRGTLTCTGLTKGKSEFPENPIFLPFDVPFEEFSPDGKALFRPTLAAHGELDWGQIYGLTLPLTMGGEMRVDNFRKIDAFVHMNILAEIQPLSLIDIQVGASGPLTVRPIG